MFETPTDVYSFKFDKGNRFNISFMTDTGEDECEVFSAQTTDVVEGDWKTCYVPNIGYVICTDSFFENINDIKEFEELTGKKIKVTSQEEYKRVTDLINDKHQRADIAAEVMNSNNIKDLDNTDAIFLNINIKGYEEDSEEMVEYLAKQMDKAEDCIISLADFTPRMMESDDGSYTYFPRWRTTNIKCFYDINNDLCAVILSEKKKMGFEDIISFYNN